MADFKNMADDNTVMVHIRRIRERIEPDPSNPIYLRTVRGLGYKLVKENTTTLEAYNDGKIHNRNWKKTPA